MEGVDVGILVERCGGEAAGVAGFVVALILVWS